MPEHPTPVRWEPDIMTQLVEQVKGLRREINDHAESDTEMYRKIDAALESIRKSIETKYVTQEEFKPIKAIAYGIVTVFMFSVLAAIAAMVVIGGKTRVLP